MLIVDEAPSAVHCDIVSIFDEEVERGASDWEWRSSVFV